MHHPVVALLLAGTLLSSGGDAQAVPSQFNTQGVLWDSSGTPVDSTDADITFRLYDAETSGALLWSELQTLPVVAGVFNALIPLSAATSLPQAVQDRLKVGAPLWLSIQLAGQAELPRIAIVSVPYAMHAGTCEVAAVASDLACTGCIDASHIDASSFTALDLGYTPGPGDAVLGPTVAAAISQIDALLAGIAEQLDLINQSVAYAEGAGTCGTADVSLDLQCTGCIGANEIDTTSFTAIHLGYAPDSGDLVTARNVSGAIDQLDRQLSASKTDIASTQTSITSIQSSIADLQGDVSGVQTSLTTLAGDVVDVQARIATIGDSVDSLQSAVTTLQATVAALGGGSGVAVYKQDGTTLLGKYLGTTSGGVSANCRDWNYLDANGNIVTLDDGECLALPSATVFHTGPSCGSPWGASAGTNQRITDGVGVYQTGTTPIHLSTTGCPAGGYSEGPGGESVFYCYAWSFQSGVCTYNPFILYTVSGGNQYARDNIGTVIASGSTFPRCGGNGPCRLK